MSHGVWEKQYSVTHVIWLRYMTAPYNVVEHYLLCLRIKKRLIELGYTYEMGSLVMNEIHTIEIAKGKRFKFSDGTGSSFMTKVIPIINLFTNEGVKRHEL
jgi:hypothetical protein